MTSFTLSNHPLLFHLFQPSQPANDSSQMMLHEIRCFSYQVHFLGFEKPGSAQEMGMPLQRRKGGGEEMLLSSLNVLDALCRQESSLLDPPLTLGEPLLVSYGALFAVIR